MISKRIFIGLVLVFCYGFLYSVHAQLKRSDQTAVTYEELYDDPYAINTLFVHFQPVYAEMFVTNVNAGFGVQVEYYFKNKIEFRAHARKTYSKGTDFSRLNASKNSEVENKASTYNYYELGGSYFIKDWEEDSQSKVILYSSRYKGTKWAASVPEHIMIPSKVRKIISGRLGGLIFDTSTDINRVLSKQEVRLPQVANPEIFLSEELSIYGNLDVKALYLGGSMTWIKNFAIKPDRNYGTLGNDLIFTTFLDLIVAPSVSMTNIFYQGVEYSTENIKTSKVGFRAGMEGKFNRELGWAYGAEMGVRPGIQSKGFYALLKISFPVFSTTMDHSKEAFGK